MIFLSILLNNAFSKEEYEPFSERKIDKNYFMQRAILPPKIDGFLEDTLWKYIVPISDFLQEDPDNMELPTEKTEVYLSYDNQSLYVAAKLFDTNPSAITKQLSPKDDWYGAFDDISDWFRIEIDSRHDHQTSFAFAVNASGVTYDEMVYHDGDYDSDWNAIWESEVQINEFGWFLEIEIPFSNLAFYDSKDMEWGMNITRFIERKYETINWVTFPLDIDGIVSKYGHINGFQGIFPPAKFEIRPYLMTGFTNYSDIRLMNYEFIDADNNPLKHKLNYKDYFNYNIGVDILYRLQTNSKLAFTINPDFGQVEADPANVNLTAFEPFFLEKRPFFLQDVDIFSTPIDVFYSRRIGANSWASYTEESVDRVTGAETVDTIYYNVPVTIKGAGKLSGKTESGLSYGLLGAITTQNDSSNFLELIRKGKNSNYIVSRLKQDILEGNSFFGLMTTSSMQDSSHTISMDGMVYLLDNQINISTQMLVSNKYGGANYNGIYGNIAYTPPGNFNGWIDYYMYEKGLDINTLGYLWRDDYTQIKAGLGYNSYESYGIFTNISFSIQADMEENIEGLDLGKTREFLFDLEFENFYSVGGGYYHIDSHFDDRKIIYDIDNKDFGPSVPIPTIYGTHLNLATDKHQKLWASIHFTSASNTRNDIEEGQFIELTYKPNPYISFITSYDRYRLMKKYHWIESLKEQVDGWHHIFSDLNRQIDTWTLRLLGNINRKLSLHGYLEIFSNYDLYTSYSEFSPVSNQYEETSYISGVADQIGDPWSGMPVYSTNITNLEGANATSYVDPNLYSGYYPKYTSMIFNGIIKWNYMKGSNIYFVLSFNKSINGTPFRSINDFSDFLSFNSQKPWVEVLRDYTFMVKIDYWFEK